MYDPDRLKQIWTTPRPVLDILDRILTGPGPFRTTSGPALDRTWTCPGPVWTESGPVLDLSGPYLDQHLVVNCRLTITKYRFQSTVITAGRIIAVNSFNLRLLNGDKKGDKSFL